MKNSIAGPAIAALVGAVVALVVAGSGLARFEPPANVQWLADATIFIDSNGSGGCTITTIPQTLAASRHGKVEWSIVNRCAATDGTDVEVTFKSDPLDPTCNKKGKKGIKCGVNPKAAYGPYKYTVTAGAYSEDPDLEIAQ